MLERDKSKFEEVKIKKNYEIKFWKEKHVRSKNIPETTNKIRKGNNFEGQEKEKS